MTGRRHRRNRSQLLKCLRRDGMFTFSSRSSVNACSQFTSGCGTAFPADFFPFDIALNGLTCGIHFLLLGPVSMERPLGFQGCCHARLGGAGGRGVFSIARVQSISDGD